MSDSPETQDKNQQQAPFAGANAQGGTAEGSVISYAKGFCMPFTKLGGSLMFTLGYIVLNIIVFIVATILVVIGAMIYNDTAVGGILFGIVTGIPLLLVAMGWNADALTRMTSALNSGTPLPGFIGALVSPNFKASLKISGAWVLLLVAFAIAMAIVFGLGFWILSQFVHPFMLIRPFYILASIVYIVFFCFFVPFTVFSAAESLADGVPASAACHNAAGMVLHNIVKVVLAYIVAVLIALITALIVAKIGEIAYIGKILAFIINIFLMIAQFSGWIAVRNSLKK